MSQELETSEKAVKKTNKKIIALIIVILLLILMGIYVFGCIFYRSHFLFNTIINYKGCSNFDVNQVVFQVDNKSTDYELDIYGALNEKGEKGSVEIIKGEDIDYKYSNTYELVKKALDSQNEYLWPFAFFSESKEIDIFPNSEFDEAKLLEVLGKSKAFDVNNMIAPENAYLEGYSEAEAAYVICEESFGTQLINNKAVKLIEEAISQDQSNVDLIDGNCYKKASITKTNSRLLKYQDMANTYISARVVYDWNGKKVVVDGSKINEWIDIIDSKPVLDESMIESFVSEQAKENDTYGKVRTFKTVNDIEIDLKSGAYGWKTDREAETKNLISYIYSGEEIEVEPEYISRGYAKGVNDIGNSYVEIDMSHQHLYLFENGKIVLESDFVSGNMSNGCGTPAGVFGITYKTKNAVLRGDNYATPVSYWMPFNGNVGMHDATWRRSFGGDIYLTSGSHGCINLPLSKAKEIYEYMEKGFPVVCYY